MKVATMNLCHGLGPRNLLVLSNLLVLATTFFVRIRSMMPDGTAKVIIFSLMEVVRRIFLSGLTHTKFVVVAVNNCMTFVGGVGTAGTLICVSVGPLNLFQHCPCLTTAVIVPVKRLLFVAAPSTTKLKLLLITSICPILVDLKMDRLATLSIVTTTALFSRKPKSTGATVTTRLVKRSGIRCFVARRLPLMVPASLIMVMLFCFGGHCFSGGSTGGRRSNVLRISGIATASLMRGPSIPLTFTLLPMLPLTLLVFFSPFIKLFRPAMALNAAATVLFSLFLSLMFILFRAHDIHAAFGIFTDF